MVMSLRKGCFRIQQERKFNLAYAEPGGGIPEFYLCSGKMVFP
jgi:hypothetical protein